MRRRLFLALIGAACPALAFAQGRKAPRLGLLNSGNPEPFLTSFTAALRAEGYQRGDAIEFEFRTDQGNTAQLAELANELVRMKVDVIVATPTPAAEAAKRATTSIPIVMLAGDPLATGLVSSLARPGGNVTGVSSATAEISGKCVEIIKEAAPKAKVVSVLANATDPFTQPFLQHIAAAGLSSRIQIRTLMIRRPDEIASAFTQLQAARPDFLLVQPSLPREAIVNLAGRYRLPTISPTPAWASVGGLIAYAANVPELYRSMAGHVAKILRGAKPSDLPVLLPQRYDLVINLKTAKTLGFSVPRSLLMRAETIQ